MGANKVWDKASSKESTLVLKRKDLASRNGEFKQGNLTSVLPFDVRVDHSRPRRRPIGRSYLRHELQLDDILTTFP